MNKVVLVIALLTSFSVMAQQISIGKLENRLRDGKTKTEDMSYINFFYVGKDLQGNDVDYPITKLSHGGRLQGKKHREFMGQDVYQTFVDCFNKNPKGHEFRMMTSRDTFEYALTRNKGYDVYLVKRYQIPWEFNVTCVK